MANIEKIATESIQKVSNAIQKADNDAQKAVQTIQLEKLDGLNALANQKMPFVQAATNPILSEEEKLIAFTKEQLSKKCARSHINIDFPSDDIMGFIVRNFIDSKLNNKVNRALRLKPIIDEFNEMEPERAKKIINSKFVAMIMNLPNATDGFKYNCITDIPDNKLDSLEQMIEHPFLKTFSEKFFSKENWAFESFSDLISEFQEAASPVLDFSKLDKSSAFYDLLIERNSADITDLAEILKNHIQSCDDKEIGELHSLLKTLLEAKLPGGEFVFGSSEVGDKTSKTMMSGIENIIKSKSENPEEFKTLMNLLELTKRAQVPPCVLGTLAKNGKINPAFISQVQKLEQGANQIKRYTSKISAIENSKLADVVQIGDELFYRNQEGLSKINLDLETFNTLFPKIESMALSQGKLGDCYLVGAIYDFMQNDKDREKIFNMFSLDGNDIIVTIPDAREFPIRYVNGLIEKDGEKNINAPKGIQMLEDAYRQTRALKYNTSSKMTSIEGGNQMSVYNAFLGNYDAKFYEILLNPSEIPSKESLEKEIEDINTAIKELQAKIKNLEDSPALINHAMYLQDQAIIKNVNELQAIARGLNEMLREVDNYISVDSDKLVEKLLEFSNNPNYICSIGTIEKGDWLDKGKLIHSNHAYSIKNVDKNAKTIDIVNPWNSAQYVTVSFDEFKKYFSSLSVAKID